MAVGDAHVFPVFLTPVLTTFFPKPPNTFLSCFRGERMYDNLLNLELYWYLNILKSKQQQKVSAQVRAGWPGPKLFADALSHFFYTPASKKRGYTVLALSVLPSVNNIFRRTFLSNHASQPIQTWYGASGRGPTSRLPNWGPPAIYFLFPGSVHFWGYILG